MHNKDKHLKRSHDPRKEDQDSKSHEKEPFKKKKIDSTIRMEEDSGEEYGRLIEIHDRRRNTML